MENIILKCIDEKGYASFNDDILPEMWGKFGYAPSTAALPYVINEYFEQLIYSAWAATGSLICVPKIEYGKDGDMEKGIISITDMIYKLAG